MTTGARSAAVGNGGGVYIVGVAETPLGRVTDHSELSMLALAATEALNEAGLTLRDVDGLFVSSMGEESTVQVGEYLGVQPRYADSTDVGGGSAETFIHHAMLALAAGRCTVALIGFASRQRTKRTRHSALVTDASSIIAQFETPHRLPVPLGHIALVTARYQHQYGVGADKIAEVALAARSWAQLNPKAWARDPLTLDEVVGARLLCDPLRALDVCLRTDGGGVVILTTPDRARNAARPAVQILGAGESHTHWHLGQMPDLTTTAATASARDALEMAGVRPADVDVFQPYDVATITPLLALEDIGFCGRGEAADFIAGGLLRPGGALPSMTSGGGLSYNHPGALGVLLLIEAVRQLRGEAAGRQVPDPKIALVQGYGGLFSTASTVVLANA